MSSFLTSGLIVPSSNGSVCTVAVRISIILNRIGKMQWYRLRVVGRCANTCWGSESETPKVISVVRSRFLQFSRALLDEQGALEHFLLSVCFVLALWRNLHTQYLRSVVAKQHFTSYPKLHNMLADMEGLYVHIAQVSSSQCRDYHVCIVRVRTVTAFVWKSKTVLYCTVLYVIVYRVFYSEVLRAGGAPYGCFGLFTSGCDAKTLRVIASDVMSSTIYFPWMTLRSNM